MMLIYSKNTFYFSVKIIMKDIGCVSDIKGEWEDNWDIPVRS